ANVVVCVNPNNPDGRLFPTEDLLSLAADLARKGGVLIVDCAFADVMPDADITRHAGVPGLVILRSFGKFFGLAGLRLGFALAEEGFAARLNAAIGPWPVSGPAIIIAERAMRDTAWMNGARKALTRAATRLDGVLADAGLAVIGGTPLFRLIEHDDAKGAFERLGRQGILVRAFEARPSWLRMGLPGDETSFERLTAALDGENRP
ncbi:MAG: aminotransferase class I/II-fold pyridoxal phosphate-dependent enzyme, partial [Rhodospirillales bacterium]|nr:aminotransferase class I/II-fold pyridoxal phosphate-dependent enzyme [Rhodospirillales bacterium]